MITHNNNPQDPSNIPMRIAAAYAVAAAVEEEEEEEVFMLTTNIHKPEQILPYDNVVNNDNDYDRNRNDSVSDDYDDYDDYDDIVI